MLTVMEDFETIVWIYNCGMGFHEIFTIRLCMDVHLLPREAGQLSGSCHWTWQRTGNEFSFCYYFFLIVFSLLLGFRETQMGI